MNKKNILKPIYFLMEFLRPLAGPSNVCIYPVDCPSYAKWLIENKPLLKAIPLIFIRVMCCNPITTLIWHFKFRK